MSSALPALTLLHRAVLLVVAVLRPSAISVAYLALFLLAHQRLGVAMDSVAALLQLAAAAIVAIAALVQTLDPAVVPSADHVVPCASGAAGWTPDVAVLAESCLLLAFGVHARCTRGRPREEVDSVLVATEDDLGCFTGFGRTVVPLVLTALAAALLPGVLGLPLWLTAHAALLSWACRRPVLGPGLARRLPGLTQVSSRVRRTHQRPPVPQGQS